MSDEIEKRNLAVRTAKKILIQNVAVGKRKRATYSSILENEIGFLGLDSSLSLWNELEHKKIARPSAYNQFHTHEVEGNFQTYLEILRTRIAKLNEQIGFCFFDDWKCVGVAIINSRQLAKRLSELMFKSNDEMAFYNPQLTKAILLVGDRTGTGEFLNQLSVSVLGSDWQNELQDQGARPRDTKTKTKLR